MRKTFFFMVSLFIGSSSFAQNASNSPYSTLGIGETNGLDHPVFLGLGNTLITASDSTVLNFYNPSTYNTMAKGQPLFSLGVSSRLSTFTEGDTKEFSPETSLHHLAIGFSFAKHFGAAFGMQPYSRRNYNFATGTTIDSDSLFYRYQGDGSISKAFFGLSVNLLPFLDSTSLSVGANGGFLFGNVSNIRKSYTSDLNGGVGIKSLDVRSFHYDFGAYLKHEFNESHSVGLFATIDPLQNIKSTYDYGIYYASNVENPNVYDTTFYQSQTDGTLKLAPQYTFGLSYTLKLNDTKEKMRDLHPVVSFHASYGIEDWSKYVNEYSTDTTSLSNTSKITFGIQYIPEHNDDMNTSKTGFFSRLNYRAGFYRYTLPYTTGGEQVSDFGTTFGLGIPVRIQRSLSSINLGFSMGQRGVSDQQLLNEKYYGINFGLTIAPSFADRWFRKRKLN